MSATTPLSPPPSLTSERFAGLDGLRAFAVAVVVFHNYRFQFNGGLSTLRAGYVGVTLFFVLSGFLITWLLQAEFASSGRIGLRAFYLRRAYRLLPALGVTLVFLVALSLERGRSLRDVLLGVLVVVAYVWNWVLVWWRGAQPLAADGWGPLWSLSVEEQFYFVWPVLLFGLLRVFGGSGRRATRRLLVVLLGAVVVVTGWRTWLWTHGASESRLYLATDVRVDALLLGAAFAVLLRDRPQLRDVARRWSALILPSMALFVVFGIVGSRADPEAAPGWLLGPGMILVSAVALVAIWLAIAAPADSVGSRILNHRVVTWVGERSYGIYLLHYPIFQVLGGHTVAEAGEIVLTLIAADVSYRFIERPIRRRLPQSAHRRAAPASDGSISASSS